MIFINYISRKLGIISKENIIKSLSDEELKFQTTFRNIIQLLESEKHYGQANFVKFIQELLELKKVDEFIKEINSVNMWGGSGAVWEVYFVNKKSERKFQIEIINLIDLMERTKIIVPNINPIRKFFKKELLKELEASS